VPRQAERRRPGSRAESTALQAAANVARGPSLRDATQRPEATLGSEVHAKGSVRPRFTGGAGPMPSLNPLQGACIEDENWTESKKSYQSER